MSKFNKHIIIVGTARSGTSWLSEMVASQKRYRLLYEPEHEIRTKKGYLLCDKWIEGVVDIKETGHYLKNIFQNRVNSDWIAQNSNRKFKRHLWPFLPKKYIIKFVRANLSAKFMNEEFNIPVIHIIRNPYDVIRSQQRANFPWLIDFTHFIKQEKLVSLIKDSFDLDITHFQQFTRIEKLTIRWCIENVIPLEVLEPASYLYKVVKYEDLIADVGIFKSICKEFDLEPIKNIDSVYRKPSSKTPKDSIIRTNKERKSYWSNEELKQVTGILTAFKTQLYPIRKSEAVR